MSFLFHILNAFSRILYTFFLLHNYQCKFPYIWTKWKWKDNSNFILSYSFKDNIIIILSTTLVTFWFPGPRLQILVSCLVYGLFCIFLLVSFLLSLVSYFLANLYILCLSLDISLPTTEGYKFAGLTNWNSLEVVWKSALCLFIH